MSLLSYMMGTDCPQNLPQQDFGLHFGPDDIITLASLPLLSRYYYRPWNLDNDMSSSIKTDKSKFEINLDVQHFSPEEITVKTADGFIEVACKHEEKKDEHGFISRQFTRRYVLPVDCNPEAVYSRLSSDGVLTIIAPKTPRNEKKEREVPITRTGPVRQISKEKKETCSKEDECKTAN